MSRARLDERQLAIRHRLTAASLGVALVLVFVNGAFLDAYGMWGTGMDQALTILWLTILSMSVPAIWRGAYFGPRERSRPLLWVMGAAGLLGVATIVRDVVRDHGVPIWHAGHAGPHFTGTVTCFAMLVLAVTIGLRVLLDQRLDRRDEQPEN